MRGAGQAQARSHRATCVAAVTPVAGGYYSGPAFDGPRTAFQVAVRTLVYSS